jgi:hypothetical protein
MTRREYKAGRPTTLTGGGLAIGGTSFTIESDVNWPTGADNPFWVTIDGGEPNEERILCSSRSGTTVTVATSPSSGRGQDTTTETNHASGATIWPSWSATDADEANAHVNATGYASFSKDVHGLGSGDGVVVGTDKAQTLTAKTLASPTITGTITGTGVVSSGNILDGTIVNADISASAAIAASKLSGVVTPTSTDTLTNKTLTSPEITGGTLNGGAALTVTSTELNVLDGVTATTAELNILNGVTATASEINRLDGLTATAAELNRLDGITPSTAELNYVDGVTSAIQTQLNNRLETSRVGAKVFIQTSQPSSGFSTYDIWIDY